MEAMAVLAVVAAAYGSSGAGNAMDIPITRK
jgi:hypothetical protein